MADCLRRRALLQEGGEFLAERVAATAILLQLTFQPGLGIQIVIGGCGQSLFGGGDSGGRLAGQAVGDALYFVIE